MEWIKCGDRMPPENKRILFIVNGFLLNDVNKAGMDEIIVSMGAYFKERRFPFIEWPNEYEYDKSLVTHWLLVPDEPKLDS